MRSIWIINDITSKHARKGWKAMRERKGERNRMRGIRRRRRRGTGGGGGGELGTAEGGRGELGRTGECEE